MLRQAVVGSREVRAASTLAGAAAFVAVAASIALPGRLSSPARRVANADADARGPIYNIAVDDDAMRRAGELVPDDARYALWWSASSPQYEHDLLGAALLYFTPALPVRDARDADWVLSYLADPRLPEGVRALASVELADGVELIRVEPS
jgi:hypothetical protein